MSVDEERPAVFAYMAYVSEWIAHHGEDPMVYDLASHYDSTLTVDENIRILCEAYPTLRAHFVTRPNFLEWLHAYERSQRVDRTVRPLSWWLELLATSHRDLI
jgi:hypothetical protein